MTSEQTIRSRNPDEQHHYGQGLLMEDNKGPVHDILTGKGSHGESAVGNGGESSSDVPADWRRNKPSIFLLLFLYLLQGIPLGLAGSIPLILQQANVGYKDQAMFSLVFWPFTLKLLWAPVVDGIYNKQMGRRKSWLVPVQYGIGIIMIWLSFYVISMIGDGGNTPPKLMALTVSFFILNLLAATQDIAVDGWALTMLDRSNVGYASTCNSMGQTAGYFLGNVVFLALESADFCNKYLRFEPAKTGIVTLDTFLFFWGLVFLVTTSLVWAFKPEKPECHALQRRASHESDQENERSSDDCTEGESLGIGATYWQLLEILRLRNIQTYVVCALLSRIGTAAADSLTGLKLIEYGVPKEKLALLGVPVVPVQIILPMIISRFTAGPRPLSIWMMAYVPRLLCGFVFAAVVWWTRNLGPQVGTGEFPSYYYVTLILVYCLHQVAVYCMFVAIMAWHSRISDPRVGGTYMTLLNTVSNLSANWPSMAAMYFVDMLTSRECRSTESRSLLDAACPAANSEECKTAGGQCIVTSDGYYYEIFIGVAIGLWWFFYLGKKLRSLQLLNLQSWRIPASRR